MYRRLFFLYVWAEPPDAAGQPAVWRYRLEDAITHEQRLFSRLSALEQYFHGEVQPGSAELEIPSAGLDTRTGGA